MAPQSLDQCSYEGCMETQGLTDCYYPYDGQTPESELLAGRYCYDRAYESGFCASCGRFWCGTESFDFPKAWGNIRGLCEECSDALQSDLADDDEDFPYAYWGSEW